MKSEIAKYLTKCLTCQKVKIKYQKSSRLLHPLDIPQWKWEHLAMDFVNGLPKTSKGYDVIWVVIARLTKSPHFLSIQMTYWTGWKSYLLIRLLVCMVF